MYLLYLDESGDPHGWNSQKVYVIGGISVFEGEIARLTQQVDNIQRKYFPNVNIMLNLHAHEIYGGKGQFKQLGSQKQQELMFDMYDLIGSGSYPSRVTFSTAMDISYVTSTTQVVSDTFQDVCQRFNTLMVRQYNKGKPIKGLLVIDQAHEQQYRDLLRQFQTTGTQYGYIRNIVDVPHFARAIHTRMVQLADFVAYAVFRYYEYSDTTFMDKIVGQFDRRSPSHPPEGFKHFIKTACKCYACYWR